MNQSLPRLDGRIIIVSGAGGGGIGTSITRLAAEAGATVLAVDKSPEHLDQHISPLEREGLSISRVVADVLGKNGIDTVMDCVRNTPGELHGLVTVIGGAPPQTWGPATEVSRSDWRSLFDLNLDSVLFMFQAVAKELRFHGRGGAMVAISSINGLTSSPYNVGYGASKAALQSLVKTFALELALDNIRVNAIAPGPTSTPTASLDDDPQRLRRGIPMGRHGRADEIAGPALFLLSDLSTFMTGQCMTVDGGCNIKWCHLTDDNLPMFLKNTSVAHAMKGSP